MPEWISYTEALLRVEARLRVSQPEAALIEAIARRRVHAGYPARTASDDVDIENHPLRWMRKLDREKLVIVEEFSLNNWLEKTLNPTDQQESPPPPPQMQSRAGRKPKYDWDEYERCFNAKVAAVGLPDLQNEDGWKSTEDVKRYLLDLAAKDGQYPSDTQAKTKAREFLQKAGRN